MKKLILLTGFILLSLSHAQAVLSIKKGNLLYSIKEDLNFFTIYDQLTTKRTTLQTPASPVHFTIHNSVAYIVCRDGHKLMAIDLETHKQTTVSCSSPLSVCVANNKLYVAESKSKKIKIFAPTTLELLKTINVTHCPMMVAQSEKEDYVAVLYTDDDRIGFIETTTNTHAKYFKTGKCPCDMIFADRQLFYCSKTAKEIGIVDVDQLKIKKVIPSTGMPYSLTLTDNVLYVINTRPESVDVFIASTMKHIRSFSTPQISGPITTGEEGFYAGGRCFLPFYPIRPTSDALDKVGKNHKGESIHPKYSGPVPKDFKETEIYKELKKNPGYFQSIAFDAIGGDEVLRLLENSESDETHRALMLECTFVFTVASWLVHKVEAAKLFRWVSELSLFKGHSDSSTSTSSTSSPTSSTSSTSSVSASTSSEQPITESMAEASCSSQDTAVNNLPTTMLSINPFDDEARFPVAGMVHMGYKIISNHNKGTVTLLNVSSHEKVELQVGHYPTLILPLDHLIYVAVLGKRTLNEAGSIAVIDLNKKSVVQTLPLPKEVNPDRLAVTSKDLFVMDLKSRKMESFDIGKGRVSRIKKIKRIKDYSVEFYCDGCDKLHEEKFGLIVSDEAFLDRLREVINVGDYFTSLHHFYVSYLDDIGLTQEELLSSAK